MARPFPAAAPVDARTAICVLTHDEKFDVPALIAALETPAVYIGAMGSKVTTADREERLRAEGVGDAGIARIHAPIGLAIGARSPEEVAVAIGAADRRGDRRWHAAGRRAEARQRPELTLLLDGQACPSSRRPRGPGSVQRYANLPAFLNVTLSVASCRP